MSTTLSSHMDSQKILTDSPAQQQNTSNQDADTLLSNNLVATEDNIDASEIIDLKALKASAGQASALLKSLSHPDRLLLLCQMVQGELCVQDLETSTGIKQPSLSQQLGVLRDNNLVATRREGRQIYYRIDSDDAMAIMEVLYQRFCHK